MKILTTHRQEGDHKLETLFRKEERAFPAAQSSVGPGSYLVAKLPWMQTPVVFIYGSGSQHIVVNCAGTTCQCARLVKLGF